MRKHWQYFQTAFTQSLQFRGEIIVWIVLGILPTIIFLIAWNSIFTGQATINGFTFGEMVQYYLIISFLGNITGVYFESWRSAQIREGTVDHHLIKPLSFPRMIALSDLGRKMLYIVFSLPFFLALIFVLIKLQVPLPAILLTPNTILALGFMIIFAYLLEFIVALMVVMATFWFEGAEGLQHFKWFFVALLSGKMMPVVFMPSWLQNIIAVLPLRYSYSLPAEVIQGKAVLTSGDVIYMTGSVIVLFGLCKVMWQRAQLKYSSAGG